MPRNDPSSVHHPPYLFSVALKRDEIGRPHDYPYALPAFVNLEQVALHPSVTFLVGENGSGKSTLLEAIAVACGFNPEGGSRNFHFETRASHSDLHEVLRISRSWRRPRDGFFLRAESMFTVATEIERLGVEDAYGMRTLHEQSHGESFLAVLTERFHGDGLYLLDEPEAALSPTRQMSVLSLINQYVHDGAQFIIATHSPILLAYPHATILEFGERGIAPVEYEATEHFRVTRDFLNRYPAMLRVLME